METKIYILTTHNAESKGCAPELTLEEYGVLPDWIKIWYSRKEFLR